MPGVPPVVRLCISAVSRLLALLALCTVLVGCGGGAGGATVTDNDPISASGRNGVTAATAASPIISPDTPPIPPPTGSPSTAPSPAPDTSTGEATFSGKIVDENGNGLGGVALEAQPIAVTTGKTKSLSRNASSKTRLSKRGFSLADGTFEITGFDSKLKYAVTASYSGRKTLRTVLIFDKDDLKAKITLQITCPPGTGLVEFDPPTTLKLTSVTTQRTSGSYSREATLQWTPSQNPGFMSYLVFRSETPNQGLNAEPLKLVLTSSASTYTDLNVTRPYYYRVYEKVSTRDAGTFVFLTSNEIRSNLPSFTVSPDHGQESSSTTQPIKITFSGTSPVNKTSVESALKVTSVGVTPSPEPVSGSTSWNDQGQLVFSLAANTSYKPAHRITVDLTGAKDEDGNEILTQREVGFRRENLPTTTFIAATGYKNSTNDYASTVFIDSSSEQVNGVPTEYDRIFCNKASGEILLHRTSPTSSDSIRVFNSTGSLTQTITYHNANTYAKPTYIDAEGNIFTDFRLAFNDYSIISATSPNDSYPNRLGSTTSEYTAVDSTRRRAFDIVGNDNEISLFSSPPAPNALAYTAYPRPDVAIWKSEPNTHLRDLDVDSDGNLYAADDKNLFDGYPDNNGCIRKSPVDQALSIVRCAPLCGQLSYDGDNNFFGFDKFQKGSPFELKTDGTNNIYVVAQLKYLSDPPYSLTTYTNTYFIQKFASNGAFVTQFPVGNDLSYGLIYRPRFMAVDSQGNVYCLATDVNGKRSIVRKFRKL